MTRLTAEESAALDLFLRCAQGCIVDLYTRHEHYAAGTMHDARLTLVAKRSEHSDSFR